MAQKLHDMAHLLEDASQVRAEDIDDFWSNIGSATFYTVVHDDGELMEETYEIEAGQYSGELAVPVWGNEPDARQAARNEGPDYGVMKLSNGQFDYRG